MNYEKGSTISPDEPEEAMRGKSRADTLDMKAMESCAAPLMIGEPMRITPCDTLSLFLNNLPPGSKVTIEIGGNPK